MPYKRIVVAFKDGLRLLKAGRVTQFLASHCLCRGPLRSQGGTLSRSCDGRLDREGRRATASGRPDIPPSSVTHEAPNWSLGVRRCPAAPSVVGTERGCAPFVGGPAGIITTCWRGWLPPWRPTAIGPQGRPPQPGPSQRLCAQGPSDPPPRRLTSYRHRSSREEI